MRDLFAVVTTLRFPRGSLGSEEPPLFQKFLSLNLGHVAQFIKTTQLVALQKKTLLLFSAESNTVTEIIHRVFNSTLLVSGPFKLHVDAL